MADRLFVDLSADGQVSISTSLDEELPGTVIFSGEPRRLEWPLDADALEELRWYLEDYLRTPFGVYESRGPEIATRLRSWGERLFEAVFGEESVQGIWASLQGRSTELQVVFRSESADMLGLPWELMRNPAGGLPLALDAVGMDRTLPTGQLGAPLEVPAHGQLRVLIVISRPDGAADVGFHMIARPLLARLEAVRGSVDLVVLRPPTLDALAATLMEAAHAGKPFQVVHFDGHGALASHRGADATRRMRSAMSPEGVLLFQAQDGGRDPVPASRVAQVLSTAQVPIVVLNACQSGAIGKQVEAAIATRLLQDGAVSVVAMAYSVYAIAAAEFMAAFYERLFAGDTISAAVTAGRQQMFNHDRRPSPKGDMPLADWLVPVHYMRREVRFPGLATARSEGDPSLNEVLDQLRLSGGDADSGPLMPVGVFSGRDSLFHELENATLRQRVVVLWGPAGIGKTEAVKAFGRWWRDTGGVERPEWVFWHSFESGLASSGLDGVVAEIGLTVFGDDFARLGEDERAAMVDAFLRERRALLIWDNFESVRSLPDPLVTTPLPDDAECQRLSEFLHRLAVTGRSVVLITSRTDESWLDHASEQQLDSRRNPAKLCRIRVAGLSREEAAKYAGDLLASYPEAASRRSGRAFAELMEWLDGYPLSMRLVLPHLTTTEPQVLLAGLQGTLPLPGWDDGQEIRITSLTASLRYSFTHLDPDVQRLIVAVCLFHGTVYTGVLAAFSLVDAIPQWYRDVTWSDWANALDAAAATGLLTPLGGGIYEVHPALPAFLAAQWRADRPTTYTEERAAATRALMTACGSLGDWLTTQMNSGDAGLAHTIFGLLQRTMAHFLGSALAGKYWEEALAISQPAVLYWEKRGMYEELDAWAERVPPAVKEAEGHAPRLDSPAGALWSFWVGELARRQVASGLLDAAEQTYRMLLSMVQAQPASPEQQKEIATIYQWLGGVAHERGQLDQAGDWYLQSLAIKKELGDWLGMANSCHELGIHAVWRRQLDEAERWHRAAMTIREQLNDRPGRAASYHQLGMLAQARDQLDQAMGWYARALAIEQEFGDRPGMALTYHQLGTVAQELGQLDQAVGWFTRSLSIEEELGNPAGISLTYELLGTVAQTRGQLDEARDWHTRALSIREKLGDRPELANSYQQLGMLAREQGQSDEARDWHTRALSVREKLGDRLGRAVSQYMLGLLALDQSQQDEAVAWFARSLTLAEEIGDGRRIVASCHQLGALAQQRGELAEATDWYERALASAEENEDQDGIAITCDGLGRLAQDRGQLDEARDWYTRALAIREELRDRPVIAHSYDELGLLAQDRGQLDEARDWYTRALAIREELDDRPGTADSYTMLGMLAQDRNQEDEAWSLHLRALEIREDLGDLPGRALSCYLLGVLARERGQLDLAENWLMRALTVEEQIDNRPRMALTYAQLGRLAEDRGSPHRALEWAVRCVAILEDVSHSESGIGIDQLARLTYRLGNDALEARWHQVTGEPPPSAVLEYVSSHRPEIGGTLQ